jgi:hypothetical protein
MKTFVARTVLLKRDDNEFIGGTESNRHRQGDIFVAAKNKAAAIEIMTGLGYTIRPADVRVGMGNDMDALLEAGVITDDSLTLIPVNRPYLAAKVSKDENGDRHVATVGEVGTEAVTYKTVFIPAG